MFKYSKFIFKNGSSSTEVPTRTPGAAPKLGERQKKSTDLVKKKTELAKKLKGNKEKLYLTWKNNNPKGKEKFEKEDVKLLALREISDGATRKDVYLMLALIQSYWKEINVNDLYASCWEGGKFKIDKLIAIFRTDEAKRRLGFYYGTRTITWYTKPNWGYYLNKDKKRWERTSFVTREIFSSNTTTVTLTGWWTHDEGDKNNNRVEGGKDFYKDAIHKIKGDEWAGETLFKSLKHIKKEMTIPKGKEGYNDSGLSPQKEAKLVKFLTDEEKNVRETSPETAKAEVLKYLKQFPKRWVDLDSKIANKLSFSYGINASLYQYRYEPDRNKIFFIRFDGAPIKKDWGMGGYIDIKDGELGARKGMNETQFKPFLKKELLDHMSVESINSELNLMQAKTETKPSNEALLEASKDRLVAVYRKYKSKLKNVPYSKLDTDFYDKLENWLKQDLINKKRARSAEEAAKYASARIAKLKEQISAKLSKDGLKEFFDKNIDEVISINVISDTAVSVGARAKKKWNKFKEGVSSAAKAAAKAGSDIGSIAKEQYKAFMGKLGFFGTFLDKIFNFKDKIFEYIKTGKKDWGLSIAGFLFGAEISRRALNSTSITSMKEIEMLAKKNGGVTKNGMRIKESVKLKGYKIVIPKGKGIKPGSTFKVALKGVQGKVDADPSKATTVKPKQTAASGILGGIFGGIGSIFGRGRGGKKENLFKDHEIIIAQNTEITAKTYIPKGAKIIKA